MEDGQNVDKKIDAYAAGTDAFLVGQSQDANPFDLATQELAHFKWNDGWMEGEDAYREWNDGWMEGEDAFSE